MSTVIQLKPSKAEMATVKGGRSKNADYRSREYLTEKEIDKLVAAAGESRINAEVAAVVAGAVHFSGPFALSSSSASARARRVAAGIGSPLQGDDAGKGGSCEISSVIASPGSRCLRLQFEQRNRLTAVVDGWFALLHVAPP